MPAYYRSVADYRHFRVAPKVDRDLRPDARTLEEILLGDPAKDRRHLAYPWRPTIMTIPAGDVRNHVQAAVLLFETIMESRRRRQKGQGREGPLTRAYQAVMRAMLDLTHFETGKASFSYDTIAERANVPRSMVSPAIRVIEALTGLVIFRRVFNYAREVRPGFVSPRAPNVYIWRLNEKARLVRAALKKSALAPKTENRPETHKYKISPSSSSEGRNSQEEKPLTPDGLALRALWNRLGHGTTGKAPPQGPQEAAERAAAYPPGAEPVPPPRPLQRPHTLGPSEAAELEGVIAYIEGQPPSRREPSMRTLLHRMEKGLTSYSRAVITGFRAAMGLDQTY